MDSNNKNKKKGKKFAKLVEQVDPELLKKWEQEQENLKQKVILEDLHDWKFTLLKEAKINELNDNSDNLNYQNQIYSKDFTNDGKKNIKYIGGCDISCCKKYPDIAIASLVVLNKELEIVYEKHKLIKMTVPYVPGFLAFREVPPLVDILTEMKKNHAPFFPQVLLCDSNGIFHPKKFGEASHLGVLMDIPTIGCSKTVFSVDGITPKGVDEKIKNKNLKGGDAMELIGDSGFRYGYALISTDECTNPIIISPGHRVSYETSLEIVKFCIKYRVPEPVRLADKYSRKLVAYIGNLSNYERDNFDLEKFLSIQKNIDELHNLEHDYFRFK